jgi:uncharacterized protein YqkB
MNDSDEDISKSNYIFNIDITKDNKVKSINMIPIYIKDKKEVVLYKEYNIDRCKEYNTMLNNWNKDNGLNSTIEDEVIKITF